MKNSNYRSVLVCDNDYSSMNSMQLALENQGYDVDMIDNAADLIPQAIRMRPHVVIVNPDMPAFNATDVCKNIMSDMNIPVILVVDRNSTARDQVDACRAEDVITKPVETDLLLNLVAKHITVNQ
jgi:DNA-binding response OmpR family regulator